MLNNIYKNKRVYITGITGIKGSWLALMLQKLGAIVCGMGLIDDNENNMHYNLFSHKIDAERIDIRDYDTIKNRLLEFKPDIIFHMAAQSLVVPSYKYPVETFSINTLGTLYLLDICRDINYIGSIINIITDKIYENDELGKPFKETDKLGAYDPYSTSKGCSKLITDSYKKSFFNKENSPLIVSCMSGNIIGGGDMSEYRIIPDLIKSRFKSNIDVEIRSPNAIRPWLFICDTLMGYLQVGQKLLEGKKEFEGDWNFSPNRDEEITVIDLIKEIERHIDVYYQIKENNDFHEAKVLRLDSTKAKRKLKWKPIYDINTSIEKTTLWYKEYFGNNNVITEKQIDDYFKLKGE